MEHKFKKGDIIRGNVDSDKRYTITNTRMTKGEVIYVYPNGNIKIRIIEHRSYCFDGHMYRDIDPKYFDLVDEKGD